MTELSNATIRRIKAIKDQNKKEDNYTVSDYEQQKLNPQLSHVMT